MSLTWQEVLDGPLHGYSVSEMQEQVYYLKTRQDANTLAACLDAALDEYARLSALLQEDQQDWERSKVAAILEARLSCVLLAKHQDEYDRVVDEAAMAVLVLLGKKDIRKPDVPDLRRHIQEMRGREDAEELAKWLDHAVESIARLNADLRHEQRDWGAGKAGGLLRTRLSGVLLAKSQAEYNQAIEGAVSEILCLLGKEET